MFGLFAINYSILRVKYLLVEKISFEWLNPLDSNIVSVYQYLLQGHQVIKKLITRYDRSDLLFYVLRNSHTNVALSLKHLGYTRANNLAVFS